MCFVWFYTEITCSLNPLNKGVFNFSVESRICPLNAIKQKKNKVFLCETTDLQIIIFKLKAFF